MKSEGAVHPPTPEEWQLVLDNEKLLDRYIKQIRAYLDPNLLSFDELKSFGWEGMLRAAQTWDPKRGKFSTLAWFCVRGFVGRAVREELAQQGRAKRDHNERLDPDKMVETHPLDEGTDEEHEETVPSEVFQVEDPAFEDEVGEHVDLYRAVRALPPLEHEVISLFYFEERSQDEIAQLLHYTERTVRRLLKSAREHLREILTPQEGAA